MDGEKFYPFTNDFIFSLVMQYTEIHRGILERILPDERFSEIKIIPNENSIISEAPFTVETQKSIKLDPNSHGVRFDACSKTPKMHSEIEMQTYSEEDIGRRSRYYHANMDLDDLAPGKPYNDLKKAYVIFICTFDYKGLGEPVYHFKDYDIDAQAPLNDGSHTILLNTTCPLEKVPERLRPLYAYIQDPNSCEDEFIRELDEYVRKYNNPEWRRKLMTFEYLLEREKKIGEQRGKELGKELGREAERNRFNSLINSLTAAGRINDLSRAAKDAGYQKKLFEEFNL